MDIADFGLLLIFSAIVLWALGMVEPKLIMRSKKRRKATRMRVTRSAFLLLCLGLALLYVGDADSDRLNLKHIFSTAGPERENGPTAPPADGELVVHFIDVGQGDATLFQGADFTILIDAGRHTEQDVLDYLQQAQITQIDLAVGTHAHADHIGQLDQVIRQFDVQEVWLSGEPHTTRTFERVLTAIEETQVTYYEPRAGEVFQIGSILIEVLNPVELTGDHHESCLALRLTYGNVSFLFTGDIERKTEYEMLERGERVQAQIFQLGHHGSSTSNTERFLKAVDPELAIYSAGIDNSYGHPHREVIETLDRLAIETLGTDQHGTILVRTDGETYFVETEKTH